MISLVIPIYNEESLIDELIERSIKVLAEITDHFEILVVDDGSQDGTLEQLLKHRDNEKRIKILSLSRNFGHQAALTAGLEHAKGDYIAMMDGDLQDPPELLGEMYMKLKSGEYDVINGKRRSRKGSIGRRMLTYIFHKLFKRVSGLREIENVGNYSMLNRNALNGLLALKEKVRYLPGLRSFVGFKQGYIEYIREERKKGKSKMNIWKLWLLGSDAIFSFSKIPLKICLFLGLFGVVVFLLAGIYVLIAKIFGFALLGWSSTLLSIYFLGSIQLTFLGVLGEYVFRTYKESQNRPIYLVKEFYDD
ncbi:glycosyltransferase [Candidatus Heimdallarchaeota archaeon B3_Heim]|nr:MAG: glycosyltransferase [Candidatus Heimdallarchaeota archaeon B3_Heim]